MKSDPHWKKIGLHPHHGICLPLFSLKTEKSSGVGEFLDLVPLIDWCKKLKFDTIQLLPINDTGSDPSPYNPLSSCALDPIYLSLTDLGLSLEPANGERVERREILRRKMEVLKGLFEKMFESLKKSEKFQKFIQENRWVEAYGRFKALKEKFEGKYWIEWPDQKWEEERVEFYIFLQYHCFSQMGRVKQYAAQQGIFIKGDMPILISPDSADVWSEPHLFIRDIEAGAPPDYYNSLGQKWGFPLFNWEAMRKDHFQWWKQRLKTIEPLFHIYRIDHVVGFFRIWGIAKGKKAAEGSFYPPDEKKWYAQGREILEMMLDASPLLPIAEDLGIIPKPVYPILKELGICGTKVVRWQTNLDGDRKYIPFNEYERLSLTTVSTHDMPPLESWWIDYPAEAVPFAAFMHWSYYPILTQWQRREILKASHSTSSLFHINLLQEYLALFPSLVWPNREEERINTPGDLTAKNWTYRFRRPLEEIVSHKGLEEEMGKIIG